jgi:hypothetical protein
MKERKIHYRPSRHKDYMQCGGVWRNNTQSTWNLDSVTCRVCMFSYLAEQAPWAREFMGRLRGADVAAKRSSGSFEGMEARVMAAGPTAFDRVNPDGMPPALVLAMDYGGSICPGCPACPHQPEVEARHVLRRNPIRFEGSGRPLGPVAVPATLSEKVDGKEERLGRRLRTLLRQQGSSQELVSEFLTQPAPTGGTVQPVMDDSGTTAEPVGVQPGKVAEQAGDAGKVSQEVFRDF